MDDNELMPNEMLMPLLTEIQQDGEQALAHLEELLPLYERDPRLHFLRGSVLAGLERYVPARAAMQLAVDIAPDYAVARFQLGFLALTSGDPNAARATWQPLLNLPQDDPLNLFVQGLNHLMVDEFEAAIALLEQGIALNTTIPPMNKDMALIVREAREKLDTHAPEEEVESGAHFLLRQYGFKDTKH